MNFHVVEFLKSGILEFNDSIKVNTRRGNAAIISEEEYNSLMETVYLSSIPDFINKVKEGEKEDIEKCLPIIRTRNGKDVDN